MVAKIEDQKAQCDSAIEAKVHALASAMKVTPAMLGSPSRNSRPLPTSLSRSPPL